MGELFVTADRAQLKLGPKEYSALLWGDRVIVEGDPDADEVVCRAHGYERTGTIPRGLLGPVDPKLLEIYVIDVGQGDAILIRTPNHRWHLVDGGPRKATAMLEKNARRFLAWKFARDLDMDTVKLENVILSHSDWDHFGGLTEILASDYRIYPDERPLQTTVERFLHAGIAKFKGSNELGLEDDVIPAANQVSDRATFESPPREFATEYGKLAKAVCELKTADGDPTEARRVRRGDFIPGYGEDATVSMRILGPMPENGAGDLPKLGDEGETVNGHSVVMRIDYGDARVLLTGDINSAAEERLLADAPEEFAADVVKACHHGSDDLDPRFAHHAGARVTVVSSGDSEGYSHPRPQAVGAYAYYGRRSFSEAAEPQPQPPMIYSTEVARSMRFEELDRPGEDPLVVVEGTVYGLVNVRTDGKRILCATRNEADAAFDVESFPAGQSPADDDPPL